MKKSVVFFGSPDIAARLLTHILEDKHSQIEITSVVTQPPRPVGRQKTITKTPVHQVADEHNLPVITDPENDDRFLPTLSQSDFALLYAYGKIIPLAYLKAPKHGFINVHPSLLPTYRGASPLAFPVLMGEGETGVSLMQMDEELDHGPLLGQKKIKVSPTDFSEKLGEHLTDIAYELLQEIVPKIGDSTFMQNQDHSRATYTRKLTKQDGYISPQLVRMALSNAPIITADLPILISEHTAQFSPPLPRSFHTAGETLWNLFRALHPWPGLWTKVHIAGTEKRLKITGMEYNIESSTPTITRVQLEGKQEVDFDTFVKAYGKVFV